MDSKHRVVLARLSLRSLYTLANLPVLAMLTKHWHFSLTYTFENLELLLNAKFCTFMRKMWTQNNQRHRQKSQGGNKGIYPPPPFTLFWNVKCSQWLTFHKVCFAPRGPSFFFPPPTTTTFFTQISTTDQKHKRKIQTAHWHYSKFFPGDLRKPHQISILGITKLLDIRAFAFTSVLHTMVCFNSSVIQ